MASASDVRAGRAFIELGVNDKIGAGLNKVAARFKAFGASITGVGLKLAGIGAAIEAPFVLAAKIFADTGDAINKASIRTGVAADALTELKYAAEQSGVSFEDLETAIKKAQKQGISTDEIFGSIADRIASIQDPVEKVQLALSLFGKSGTTMIPLLNQGSEAIEKMRQRARELGITFGSEDADAATKFHDSLKDVGAQLKAIAFQAGAAVAKALQPFADTITGILKVVIDWVKANPKLVVTIAAIGAVAIATGIALVLLGAIITSIGAIIAFVATPLGVFTIGIASLVVGLAAAAVVFFKFTNAGRIAGAQLKALGAIVTSVVGSMADAFSSGNVELAVAIMFAGIKAIFLEKIADLEDIWVGFLNAIFPAAVGNVLKLVTQAEVAQAGKDLAELQKTADAMKRKTAKGERGRVGIGAGDFEDLTSKGKDTSGALGIFNGAALRSLQSAPVWDRVAKATEETAKNTRKLQGAGLR